MLVLRLVKVGKKKDKIFRLVAVDSHKSVTTGKFKEILGWWNPKIDKFNLKEERIKYWLKQGAQLSDSAHNLLVTAKIISGPKRKIKIRPKKKKGGTAEEQPEVKVEQPAESSQKEEKAEAENKTKAETKSETKPEVKTEEKAKEEKPVEKKEEVKEKPEKKEEKE